MLSCRGRVLSWNLFNVPRQSFVTGMHQTSSSTVLCFDRVDGGPCGLRFCVVFFPTCRFLICHSSSSSSSSSFSAPEWGTLVSILHDLLSSCSGCRCLDVEAGQLLQVSPNVNLWSFLLACERPCSAELCSRDPEPRTSSAIRKPPFPAIRMDRQEKVKEDENVSAIQQAAEPCANGRARCSGLTCPYKVRAPFANLVGQVWPFGALVSTLRGRLGSGRV